VAWAGGVRIKPGGSDGLTRDGGMGREMHHAIACHLTPIVHALDHRLGGVLAKPDRVGTGRLCPSHRAHFIRRLRQRRLALQKGNIGQSGRGDYPSCPVGQARSLGWARATHRIAFLAGVGELSKFGISLVGPVQQRIAETEIGLRRSAPLRVTAERRE
jgi:hypothetical protein